MKTIAERSDCGDPDHPDRTPLYPSDQNDGVKFGHSKWHEFSGSPIHCFVRSGRSGRLYGNQLGSILRVVCVCVSIVPFVFVLGFCALVCVNYVIVYSFLFMFLFILQWLL